MTTMEQSFGQRIHERAARSTASPSWLRDHRSLRVRVNVMVLQENLSSAAGRRVCEAEVISWLGEAGFRRSDGGTWLVREVDLGQLDASEVGIVADEN
jgi:hypothetical protein